MKTTLYTFVTLLALVTATACGPDREDDAAESARNRPAETENLQRDEAAELEPTTPYGAEAEPGTRTHIDREAMEDDTGLTAAQQQEKERQTAEQASARTGGAQMQVTGELVSVDEQAGTVTVQHTFKFSDETEIEVSNDVQALAGERGNRVTIHFSGEEETPTATRIELKSEEEGTGETSRDETSSEIGSETEEPQY